MADADSESTKERPPVTDPGASSSGPDVGLPMPSSSSSSQRPPSIFERYIQPSLAEMFGVTLFVFVGTAAALMNSVLAEGLAHGLVMVGLIAAFGSISGGHLNPAVTLAALASGAVSPLLACCYICAQLVGGVVGAACCRVLCLSARLSAIVCLRLRGTRNGMMSYNVTVTVPLLNGTELNTTTLLYQATGGGAHHLGDDVTLGCGVFCEVMMTTIVVMPYLMAVIDKPLPPGTLLVGVSYIVGVIAGRAISGGSMNPARSFGPAVVMSDLDSSVWDNHWIYWVGPLAGALLSAVLYRLLFASPPRRLILKED